MNNKQEVFEKYYSDFSLLLSKKLEVLKNIWTLINESISKYVNAVHSSTKTIVKLKDPNQCNCKIKSNIFQPINPEETNVIKVYEVENIKNGGILLGCSKTEVAEWKLAPHDEV